ncbi:condensation domain-containing protein [Micromonospora peucetia]|uniref:condensation domain-containing protein n=1 Tax=Micromonospora peucetia TaxID=47871 RepID=UPI00333464C8
MSGPSPVEAIYPLTPLQEGMLLESLDAGDARAYLSQVRYTLRGAVDADALRSAWTAVAGKHQALRACVAYTGLTVPVQAVYRQPFDLVEVVDGVHDDDALDEHLRRDLDAGFDLERAPLHRVRLLERADGTWEMVWTSHHIMIDGWSIPIVISDVFVAYGQRCAGAPIDLRPAADYRDYLRWTAGRDRGQVLEHWRRALRGFTEPTPLPVPAPGAVDRGRQALAADLPAADSARLVQRARQDRVTLSTLVQAAWTVVLARFSGRDDVLFGATVSGRPAAVPGAETLVGLFINTLPVRVRVPRRVPVATWLQDLQRRFLASREHEEASLRDIRSVSEVPRHRSLFESIVVVENYPLITDDRFGDRRPPVDIVAATSREELAHPLVLSVTGGGETAVELFHDDAKVPTLAAQAMLDGFVAVLRALADGSASGVSDLLAAVPAAVPLTGGTPAVAEPPLVPAVLRDVAAASPDAVAVVDGSRRVSYAALLRAADRGAARLRRHGVVAGAPVALLADRGVDRVAATLAVWFAGGQFVPLDPAWPAARSTALLAQVDPTVVLTDDPAVAATDSPVLSLTALLADTDTDHAAGAGIDAGADGAGGGGGGAHRAVVPAEQAWEPVAAGRTNAAYTIFTSGTTGRSKPVVVEHAALAAAVAGWEAAHSFAARTRNHLHLANPAFDVAIAEVLRALCAGRTVVVASPAVGEDPAALLDLILDAQVDVVDIPPSLLRPLMDEVELSGQRLDQLSTVLIGGESWFARDYVRLAEVAGARTRVVNAYGITETSIDSAYAVLGTVAGQAETLWLDATYPGVDALLVDGAGRLVPVGARGEVWLTGPTLARGYDRDPARTALRFVPDARPGRAGARAYRTGDLGTIDGRGRLHLLGRVDAQLSVNGHRIEPQEVEAALVVHPEVAGAAVTLRDGHLVAFVTSPTATLDTERVRAHLRALLPSYAVPMLVRIDALPVTANGKLDRAALPATVDGRPTVTGHVEPSTPTERILAEVWREVLGVDRVGVRDNFFDLGGDSIAGLRVKGRAAGQGIDLQPRDVFTYQTVAELAAYVDTRETDTAVATLVHEGEVPLLPVQRLFLDHVGADPAHFDMAQGVRVAQVLDPDTIRAALEAVARRHGALRTRFRRTSGGWRQWVEAAPDPLVTFQVVDLRGRPDDRAATHQALLAGHRSGHDLANSPLWSCLVVLDDQETTLYFAVHHLVMDIYSWRLVIQDFLGNYAALTAGEPPRDAPLAGYPEYALAAAAQIDSLRESESAWLSTVGTPRPVPTTLSGGENTLAGVRSVEGAVSPAATEVLHRLRAGGGTASPVLVTLLAGFSRAYSRWSGEDLYLFVETHGRDTALGGVDTSAAVGWFTALYPATVPYRPTESFSDTWWRVRRLVESVPRPVSSFGLLRDAEPRSALADVPLPQIALNHTGTMSADIDGSHRHGLSVVPVPSLTADPTTRRDQLIDVETGVADGRFQFAVNYSSAHFDQAGIEKFAALFSEELENLPDHIEEEKIHGAV